jgi:hypothetical protein
MTATIATTAPNATTMTTMTTTTTAPDATTTMTTTTTNATAMAANDGWLRLVDGTERRSSAAKKMEKMRKVKPAIDQILKAGSVKDQAAVLHAVINHHDLAAARELAGINLSKDITTAKYVCEQSTRMLGWARSSKNAHGKTSCKKRDAAKVVLTFTAPLPNGGENVPSRHKRACLLGIAPLMLDQLDNAMIQKRQQLTDRERGDHWALTKAKKGYSTISLELKEMLLNAFHDHPHVVVLPNSKDTLNVKNADGFTTTVRKILTMVGIGTIFSDIVNAHPTIKNKVGERAFRYIVGGLGFVRRFTDSYKVICGCTECVGLQTLHRSLQAKHGMMHCKIAIDLQCRTKKRVPRRWHVGGMM